MRLHLDNFTCRLVPKEIKKPTLYKHDQRLTRMDDFDGDNSRVVTINLKKLVYHPEFNPLMTPQEIKTKRRYVKTGSVGELVDPNTGAVVQTSSIYTIEARDDASFVKVFAAGVAAAFDLSRTGYRVFQAVLTVYEQSPMRQGFAENVELSWFNDGLCGRAIDMSEKTFQRGLKELLAKNFLSPRSPNTFWVNPSLFFRGDRVRFITEYRKKKKSAENSQPHLTQMSE